MSTSVKLGWIIIQSEPGRSNQALPRYAHSQSAEKQKQHGVYIIDGTLPPQFLSFWNK